MTARDDMDAAGLRIPDLLTASEAVQLLRCPTGKRCSVKKVSRLADEGELTRVRLGALVRYTPEPVAAYEQRQAAGSRP